MLMFFPRGQLNQLVCSALYERIVLPVAPPRNSARLTVETRPSLQTVSFPLTPWRQ